MTQVTVDENWMISIDGYGNHVPHRWKEVCKRVEGGSVRETAPTGEFAWHSDSKFFPNMLQALEYIFQKNLLDNIETVSIGDYCKMVKECSDYFVEKLGGI